MSSKLKALGGLCGVLILLVVGYLFIPENAESEYSSTDTEIYKITDMNSEDIVKIQYIDGDEILTLNKGIELVEKDVESTGDDNNDSGNETNNDNSDESETITEEIEVWSMEGLDEELNQQPIRTSIISVDVLVADSLVTKSTDDFEQYGLENPDRKIIISLEDGSKHEILIGNEVLGEDKYYVKNGSEDSVYLLGKANIDQCFLSESSIRNVITPFSNTIETDVNKLEFSVKDGEKITLEIIDGIWYVTNPYNNRVLADYSYVSSLIPSILNITAKDKVIIEDGTLQQYGLDEPVAEITVFDSHNSYKVQFGSAVEEMVYIRFDEGEYIYGFNEYMTPEFADEAYDIISKTPFETSKESIESITMSKDGVDDIFKVVSEQVTEGEGEDAVTSIVKTYEFNGEVKDEQYFAIFYSELMKLNIHSKLDGEVLSLEPVIEINIEGKENISAKFYDYDGNKDFYILELNDNKNFLMEKSIVDDLVGSIRV